MVAPRGGNSYRVREFAELAGVTVKTLHHYDRLGLLRPRRTGTSYRVYRESELPRLQQILVLRFLGIPLARIAEALERPARMTELLKTRRWTVKRKRERLAMALHVLDELEGMPQPDWADLAASLRDLGGTHVSEGSAKQQKLDEAMRLIGERRLAWNATLNDYELTRDVRAAIERGDTPDTPAGMALVARWRDAIERFTGGDTKLGEALRLVAHHQPAPAGLPGYRDFLASALRQASWLE
jgi:DNA-binding transcriptional MerR regulator